MDMFEGKKKKADASPVWIGLILLWLIKNRFILKAWEKCRVLLHAYVGLIHAF